MQLSPARHDRRRIISLDRGIFVRVIGPARELIAPKHKASALECDVPQRREPGLAVVSRGCAIELDPGGSTYACVGAAYNFPSRSPHRVGQLVSRRRAWWNHRQKPHTSRSAAVGISLRCFPIKVPSGSKKRTEQ